MPVAVVRCTSYEREEVFAAVGRALEAAGGLARLPKGTVLVKPNMLSPSKPESAVCTHPEVVRAVVRHLKAAGFRNILVGDSPGFGSAHGVARTAGILEVCRDEGVRLVEFDTVVETTLPRGKEVRRLPLAKVALEADCIVNLAKLKTHSLTGFTGGIKNLFGCVPGRNKAALHLRLRHPRHLSAMFLDVYDLLRPSLTLMDGVVTMEGPGPRNGSPRPLGFILASPDALAVDSVACAIIGLDPFQVWTNQLGAARGLGTVNLKEIEIAGDLGPGTAAERLKEVILHDFRQAPSPGVLSRNLVGFASELFHRHLALRPRIMDDRCKACGVCADHCPPEAITMGERASIDNGRCVLCYCCQELCPYDAVQLEAPPLVRLLSRRGRVEGRASQH